MFRKVISRFIGIYFLLGLFACAYTPNENHQPSQNTHTHTAPTAVPSRPQPQPSSQPKPKPRPVHRAVVNPAQIVAAHNRVRSRHRLAPLSWSPALAKFSTQWANHLLQTKGCQMQHRPMAGKFKTDYGENLYWASPLRWTNGDTEIQKVSSANVVYEWANEEKFYNYNTNRCQRGQQCGHYTQMVWHNTRKVGCGLAVCADKSQVWVCSYDPPGNWQGERPY